MLKKLMEIKWRKIFKFAMDNVSAIDEVIDLIEECKKATADGKITNDERSRLMKKYWNFYPFKKDYNL